jgi:hypothetical protein
MMIQQQHLTLGLVLLLLLLTALGIPNNGYASSGGVSITSPSGLTTDSAVVRFNATWSNGTVAYMNETTNSLEASQIVAAINAILNGQDLEEVLPTEPEEKEVQEDSSSESNDSDNNNGNSPPSNDESPPLSNDGTESEDGGDQQPEPQPEPEETIIENTTGNSNYCIALAGFECKAIEV